MLKINTESGECLKYPYYLLLGTDCFFFPVVRLNDTYLIYYEI